MFISCRFKVDITQGHFLTDKMIAANTYLDYGRVCIPSRKNTFVRVLSSDGLIQDIHGRIKEQWGTNRSKKLRKRNYTKSDYY